MKKLIPFLLVFAPLFAPAQNKNLLQKLSQLPDYQFFTPVESTRDWLIHPITAPPPC
ncbi:MAG: hypothetical protein IPN76_08160 [Saprospiraceae bacterium]|nr:hypothetical protein [Saprospiraceae bacterium]